MKKLLFIPVLAGMLCNILCHAEVIQVRAVALDENTSELFYMKGEDDFRPLKLTPFRAERHIQMMAEEAGILAFYRETKDDKGVAYEPVVKTRYEDAKQTITVFLKKGSQGWSARMLEDDVIADGQRTLRFVNTLPVEVKCLVGKQVITVGPHKTEMVDVQKNGRRPVVRMIAVHSRADEEWSQFYNHRATFFTSTRLTAVAVIDDTDRSKGPEVRLVTFADRGELRENQVNPGS